MLSDFSLSELGKKYYQYHLVAYSGVRTFSGMYYGGVETCGVVACQGETLESCERYVFYLFINMRSIDNPKIKAKNKILT